MKFQKFVLVIGSFVLCFVQMVASQFEFPNLFLEEVEGSRLGRARDPREDRGPVLFPQAPIGPETSGVRIGASGYGFVPPGANRERAFVPQGNFEGFPFW